jgi:tetratricopeptide (TPR) repeat protein
VWQDVRTELHPLGLEIVTVGIDTAGIEACRPFIEAAAPEHPSLVDTRHAVAELFGVVNIPNGVWIDERGMIVRPAETAPAPRKSDRPAAAAELPDRLVEIFTEAQGIRTDPDAYIEALRDWVANGADSRFALSADEVVARSEPRNADAARGQAHFELATHLEQAGQHESAVAHFRQAHRLVPSNFSYKRQAWSLEAAIDGPLARFWQGPSDDDPDSWPYDSDWLSEVRELGAENYYRAWHP